VYSFAQRQIIAPVLGAGKAFGGLKASISRGYRLVEILAEDWGLRAPQHRVYIEGGGG